MAIIEVREVAKSFRIPSLKRDTLRDHVLGLLRPRRFERLSVLESVSFDVAAGEALGIVGRNGSGKSTLLRILTGIYRPESGSLVVRGSMTPVLELGVGWNPELDAVDNVLLLGTAMGMSLAETRGALEEILDFAGLTRFANLELKHYSSGMASRLGYSIAFRAAGEILVLDEVFAVGDAGFKLRCEDRYRALHAAGHTIVLVSHDPAPIRGFCRRALLLEKGRIAMEASGDDVFDAYYGMLATEVGHPAVPEKEE